VRAAADKWRRRIFLAVLSAAIVFLFIVLPFWLLYRRSAAPPSPEAFGPTAPAAAAKTGPETMPESSDSDDEEEDKPVRFK
jgi:hypothetical protein